MHHGVVLGELHGVTEVGNRKDGRVGVVDPELDDREILASGARLRDTDRCEVRCRHPGSEGNLI